VSELPKRPVMEGSWEPGRNQVKDQTEVQLEEYHSWSQGSRDWGSAESRDRPAPRDRTTSLLQDFMECTETARFPVPDGFRHRQFIYSGIRPTGRRTVRHSSISKHSMKVERDTPSTSTAYCWQRIGIHPARQLCWWWTEIHPARPHWWWCRWIHPAWQCMSPYSKGGKRIHYILHVYTAIGGEGYTLHIHIACSGKGYTLTSKLLVVKRDTPSRPNCWLGKRIQPHSTLLTGERDTTLQPVGCERCTPTSTTDDTPSCPCTLLTGDMYTVYTLTQWLWILEEKTSL
jgi:hypothetical protein